MPHAGISADKSLPGSLRRMHLVDRAEVEEEDAARMVEQALEHLPAQEQLIVGREAGCKGSTG